MDLKKFSRHYDLDLIPASHDQLCVGTLVWDPLFGKPRFDHPGMPDTIFAAFRDADYVDDAGMLAMIEEARGVPRGKASFAEIEVELDREHTSALEHPVLGKLEGSFDLSRVRKFKFADLEAKLMSPLMRVRVDDHLEELKRDRWEDYDGRIRRVFMITELYYGSLQVIVSSETSASLEAALATANLPFETKTSGSRHASYSFPHGECPFAMRLERVRGFTG